jgi:hypothetical protein
MRSEPRECGDGGDDGESLIVSAKNEGNRGTEGKHQVL